MRKLVCNIIQCNKCKEILHSKGRHDFVRCGCEPNWVAADGGTDYRRRVGNPRGYTDLSLYLDDPFEKIREYFSRYNNRDFRWVKLKDIPLDWLESLLQYYLPPDNYDEMDSNFLALYIKEKQFRNLEGEKIQDASVGLTEAQISPHVVK